MSEIKKSLYMRDLDYHIATDEEVLEIQKLQQKNRVKKWFKYLLLSVLLVGFFVGCQLVARKTVPYMFGSTKPAKLMIRNSMWVLLAFNILSFVVLSIVDNVFFDIEQASIIKLQVIKKCEIDHLGLVRVHYRYVTCNYDGHFLIDRVWVHSRMDFANIKEEQYIYVHRLNNDGNYEYYFLA